MKTIQKSLLAVNLLLASMTASPQCAKLEKQMQNLFFEYGEEVPMSKTINETRNPADPNRSLQSRCEIYSFTLKKKDSYQREMLDEMLRALETGGREDPNCYSVNSMSKASNGDRMGDVRRLMIGENVENLIEIGKDYDNYWNVNVIDTTDTTKTHRYAYALEWRERGKTIDVRYIVTYAKIPSAIATITKQDWPYIDLGKARVKPGDRITIKGPARFQWDGKNYSIEQLDSVIRDAEKRSEQISKQLQKRFSKDNKFVIWADTLDHDTDPVTDVVLRLQQDKNVTADDLLCNDNILLVFSQLKQQYLAGQNTEFNAISIYSLCKKAREMGFFSDPNSKRELEQLKRDIKMMKDKAGDESKRDYLQMAINELEAIEIDKKSF